MMKRHYNIIKGIVLLAAMLLAACSSSDSDDSPVATSQNEIHLTTNVTSMPSGTRTTTYDDAGLKSEGSFTCVAYEANTTTPYISTTTVDWNSTNSRWEFKSGHYYWPIPSSNVDTWRSLDFFAYVPSAANLATDAPYITSGPTYSATSTPSVSHTVTFSCNMANTANKEFMFGMALGLNGGNVPETGVPMQFLHPFARVRFKLSDASGTSVKINSITLGGTYCKTADYSYDGSTSESTWRNLGGEDAFGTCQLNTDYLVIPKNYSSRTLTVKATWDEWSAVTRDISTTVDFNWASPGYSYTYVLTLKKYVLIVDSRKYTEQW